MKRILGVMLGVMIFLVAARPTWAADVVVNFFRADGCPHCAAEEEFLGELKEELPFEIHEFEVSKNPDNGRLFASVAAALGLERPGVPVTVIGNKYVVGFLNEQTTGDVIKGLIEECEDDGIECENWVQIIATGGQAKSEFEGETKDKGSVCDDGTLCDVNAGPQGLVLPFFGEVNLMEVSLPVLTLMVGLVDGFNPCAMWALLFLISLLLGMHDRKKMWILGSAFVIASGAVYFMFLAAWLQLFLFLGLVLWVRLVVGAVAMLAGGWNIREFWVNRKGGCVAEDSEKKERIFDKLKRITESNSFWLALLGIIGLAVAVNALELVCSAGLPAVYTQILALNALPMWKYYGYLFLYIVAFMADDLFVFIVAMSTLKMVGIESKYARYSHIIGGIIMLIVGILLWVRPEWLMF